MRQITDFSALSAAISAQLRPGLVTNCTLTGDALRREIAAGALYAVDWTGGLLLFRRREGFWILNYYCHGDESLPPVDWPSPTILERVLRPRDGAGDGERWQEAGFVPLFTRIRMQRSAGGAEELPPPPPVSPEEAERLLRTCFDRESGCLPDRETLAEDCAQSRILTRRDGGGALIALLRAQPQRTGTELRQLAVIPEHRGEGLADSLTGEFTRRFGGKNATVWVREDYAAPQHIYVKNGFAPDGWRADVMIRKG